MTDTNSLLIGQCFTCGCGNRPGPWHKKDCPAYMPTPDFTKVDRCPACNSADISKVAEEGRSEEEGREFTVPDFQYSVCNQCSLKFVSPEQTEQNNNIEHTVRGSK